MTNWPETFTFTGFDIDEASREVRLRYRLGPEMGFCERIVFDSPLPGRGSPLRAPFEAAVETLWLAAGVSYYKTCLPRRIEIEGACLSPDKRRFFQTLYVDGLGEFGVRNNIDVAARVDFLNPRCAGAAPCSAAKPAPPLPRRAAVLIGGGKDSLVSVEILRAGGEPMTLFAVNPKKPILDCAAASGLPFVKVARHLDPLLFQLNEAGALNGHVPITAIVSFIAVAAAFVEGFDTVVLSNERSADQGNLIAGGREVNHQYSKTTQAERDIAGQIAAHIHADLSYFSLLRPLSEAHIAALMARASRYDDAFTSCNRAFQINPKTPPGRWCGDCPKCRFSFLVLAENMGRARIERVFGKNMLDDPAQLQGYEELAGVSGHKPWECVGELAESGGALLRLSDMDEWKDAAVVRALAPRLRALMPDPGTVWRDLLTPSPDHRLPARYERMLRDYL
jgi:UDP-N-acetyl-alpha-D-muramoyl-L-alanyl-L-glutamate epimerase